MAKQAWFINKDENVEYLWFIIFYLWVNTLNPCYQCWSKEDYRTNTSLVDIIRRSCILHNKNLHKNFTSGVFKKRMFCKIFWFEKNSLGYVFSHITNHILVYHYIKNETL